MPSVAHPPRSRPSPTAALVCPPCRAHARFPRPQTPRSQSPFVCSLVRRTPRYSSSRKSCGGTFCPLLFCMVARNSAFVATSRVWNGIFKLCRVDSMCTCFFLIYTTTTTQPRPCRTRPAHAAPRQPQRSLSPPRTPPRTSKLDDTELMYRMIIFACSSLLPRRSMLCEDEDEEEGEHIGSARAGMSIGPRGHTRIKRPCSHTFSSLALERVR